MRFKELLLTCMCCVLVAPAVWGQAASSSAKPGILGYLDPQTGAFRAVPSVAEDSVDAAALATFGGTINVTLTITLKTTVITTVNCTAEVTVQDAITTGVPRFIAETDTVAATGTGTTRKCVLSIPYSWSLATQSTDNMSTTYTVSGSAASNALPQRTSTLSPLDTRKVPISGTITALAANVTI
jgi:hypothetical protein